MIRIKNICLFLITIFFSYQSLASEELYLKCSSLENPSKFVVSILAPKPGDDCDISYNDDCGRTIGSYSLTSDLSDPTNMASPDSNRKRHMGTFNEVEEGGLTIVSEGKFEAHFNVNFRNELNFGNKQTSVSIESLHSTSRAFQLICQSGKFPY